MTLTGSERSSGNRRHAQPTWALFTHLDTLHTFKEIVQVLAVQEKHHRLIRQWLCHLPDDLVTNR